MNIIFQQTTDVGKIWWGMGVTLSTFNPFQLYRWQIWGDLKPSTGLRGTTDNIIWDHKRGTIETLREELERYFIREGTTRRAVGIGEGTQEY